MWQLALVGESHAHALLPDEDYWQVVWPNTPIPSALRELLKPGPAGMNHQLRMTDFFYYELLFTYLKDYSKMSLP